VDDFEIQIRSAANNILKSLENNVNLTRESEADLLKEIDRLKQEVARVNKQEVRLDALVRKADSYRELLSEYEKRNLEALSRSNFTPIDAEVYPSQAIPADPYFPKVIPFTIAGTVAAFVLSVLGVLAVTLISGINAGRNAKSNDVAEVVYEEPEIQMDSNEIEPEENVDEPRKNSPFAQLEKIIAGQSNKLGIRNKIASKKADDEASKENAPEPSLTDSSDDKSLKEANSIAVRYASSVFQDIGEGRIIVTSPGGERGSKTTWVLARQLAASNDNGVVVIDLSGDGVTAKAMLGGNDLPGIFNLISGAVSATNIIYRDQKSGAHVVPAGTLFEGQPGPDPQTLSDVIDAIAMSYDFCIVDCGDADIEEIEVVATDDSIIIISGINARLKQCKKLEAGLKQDGFTDILHIIPDQEDVKQDAEPLLA
jgi:Mrp family chromosome partitioning ATPase